MSPLTGIPGPKEKKAAVKGNPKAVTTPSAPQTVNVVGPDGKITNVDWNGNIQSWAANNNIPLGQTGMTSTNNLANSYTKEQLAVLGPLMKDLGVSVNLKDYEAIRNTLAINFAGVQGTFEEVVTALKDRMTSASGGAGAASKYGTSTNKQINEYDPDVLKSLVDQSYQAALGRNATDDEKALRLAEISKQIAMGTTTTTTTFKGGSTTKVAPGFSQERAATEIMAKAEKEAPADLESKNQIDFHDWLLKNMGN